jgi:hypothetical protein
VSIHGRSEFHVSMKLFIKYPKTGAGTAMSRLGIADLGVATLNDMRENASMIANLDLKVPLIADADTGYGGRQLSSGFDGVETYCVKVRSWLEEQSRSTWQQV